MGDGGGVEGGVEDEEGFWWGGEGECGLRDRGEDAEGGGGGLEVGEEGGEG